MQEEKKVYSERAAVYLLLLFICLCFCFYSLVSWPSRLPHSSFFSILNFLLTLAWCIHAVLQWCWGCALPLLCFVVFLLYLCIWLSVVQILLGKAEMLLFWIEINAKHVDCFSVIIQSIQSENNLRVSLCSHW